MKKILKSRIFLCIIVGICCLGIGIYASNPYQANEILYKNNMTVNDALNELYNKKTTTTECSTLCGNVRVGDYVKMTPTSTSYTISSKLTGYSSDQTINPSELNLWRIISINNDGTIEMVSENVSSTNVYFQGQTGYLNLVGVLNEIASQYENSKYTIGSRIMGYGGQTEYITDTSKFITTAPWINSTIDNSNETLGGGDIMYLTDTNQVTEVLGTLNATNPSGTVTSYWLGSRYYFYYSSGSYDWFGRYVYAGSIANRTYDTVLYGYDSGRERSSLSSSNAIRPILTLKSGITTTGSGTSSDPLVLE